MSEYTINLNTAKNISQYFRRIPNAIMGNSLAIIIPAFNEEKTIAGVVNSVQNIAAQNKLESEIIVVNDSSLDKTGEIADTLNCTVLHLPVNLGIGGAMQT